MDLFSFLGYACAVLIGVSLGLIGGGGSILSVPVFAYLFSIDEKTATAYSLFVVGISSFIGGIKHYLKGFVDWRTTVIFGFPSLIGVISVRRYLIPILPETLFDINGFSFTRRMGMFGLFAILMIPAALSMINNKKREERNNHRINYGRLLIIIDGLLVGAITGVIGAGGGFLIIPALVIIAKMEMKTAIGTSLIIISIKSLFGFFLADAIATNINWSFLSMFSILAIIGTFIGSYISIYINGEKLKKGFGFCIIIMAILIFYTEFLI